MNFSVDLQGKTALVTGAKSGIGFGIAQGLSEAGAKVIVNDLTEDGLIEVAQSLNGDLLPGDITHPDFVRKVKSKHIDILVNNAGFQHVSPLEDFDEKIFRRLLEVMLVGPFLLAQAVGFQV
ncbi:SDR family NAD(P)-dependent oxidoreductase [Desulfosporosinus acidiphilus]|uniref:SDR family NAD(P)-dependent oxidoreductase n=1 Tax=Desulfosporosinus acidiphilus TaxID=885581 RepID=UPI000257ACAB|nr:SDR family NAD(P)-dependent oxidoreductase [Desulfosporosinus acidiphilus]